MLGMMRNAGIAGQRVGLTIRRRETRSYIRTGEQNAQVANLASRSNQLELSHQMSRSPMSQQRTPAGSASGSREP
jgi:hypothetical protein